MAEHFSKIILNLSDFNRIVIKIIKKTKELTQIAFNGFHRETLMARY